MEPNTHYWLNRVVVKLYKVFLEGFDFKVSYCWIYGWDKSANTADNLKNVAAEDRALATLAVAGVIKGYSRNNPYHDRQVPYSTGTGFFIRDGFQAHDPLFREYDKVRFLEDFYYDKFVEFCKEQGINYKEDGILATLEIINQVPMVHISNKTYTLKTLQNGSPLVVIEAAYAHADERFGFDELRQWTKKTFEAQKRFTDIFRKNEFTEGNVLSPFTVITPHAFMLKKQALLTPSQLSAIQKSRTD